MYSDKAFGKFYIQSILGLDRRFYSTHKLYGYKKILAHIYDFICYIATYPVDKIIRSLNKEGLLCKNHEVSRLVWSIHSSL